MKPTHAEMIDKITKELKEPFTRKQIIEAILKRYSQTRPIIKDSLSVDISGCCVNLRSRRHLPDLPKLLIAIGPGKYRRFKPNRDGKLVTKIEISPKEVGRVARKECPKIRKRTAEQIAQFLIRKYNSTKVDATIRDMEKWGFTKKSLTSDKNNLFRFTVLVSYDKQPFDRPDYSTVWERSDPESVFRVLENSCILDLGKVRRLSQQEIDAILRKCVAHKLHLHNTNPKNEARGTKFAKTFKDIVQNIDDISQSLSNVRWGLDVMRLHQKLCKIHGIKQTIASKFIMYTIRDLRIGNVPLSELDMISRYLLGEWHNQKWAQRLEDPSLGGRKGFLEEIVKNLRSDPMAIDYFWTLDREYCSKGRCQECDL